MCVCVFGDVIGVRSEVNPMFLRIFVKSDMFNCSFWETIQAIECHLTSQVNLLGATLKKSHRKKIRKEISETQHSVLIGS